MRAACVLALDIDAPTLARIVLSCIVPYCVFTWAAVGALRERRPAVRTRWSRRATGHAQRLSGPVQPQRLGGKCPLVRALGDQPVGGAVVV